MSEHGNNAAMREALSQCELFLGNVSRHAHPTLNPGDKCTACVGADELRGLVVRALSSPAYNSDVPGNAAALRGALRELTEAYCPSAESNCEKCALRTAKGGCLHLRARDALSSPPRNCDVLSEKEANEAWKEYMRSHALPRGGWDFRHVVAWLYAEAKKKGDSNG